MPLQHLDYMMVWQQTVAENISSFKPQVYKSKLFFLLFELLPKGNRVKTFFVYKFKKINGNIFKRIHPVR